MERDREKEKEGKSRFFLQFAYVVGWGWEKRGEWCGLKRLGLYATLASAYNLRLDGSSSCGL
jgi:hypothetical protein